MTAYQIMRRRITLIPLVLVCALLPERRVPTYTPDNPAAFQVEMGNVGQHSYAWRSTDHVWERR